MTIKILNSHKGTEIALFKKLSITLNFHITTLNKSKSKEKLSAKKTTTQKVDQNTRKVILYPTQISLIKIRLVLKILNASRLHRLKKA